MSENALEALVDELYKNGIAVEGCELTGRASGEPKKVLRTVFELDFFEHDKVFEDKIAELERTINHELDNWDKLGMTYQEILDMKAENDLLKQRIAELESKETEKPTKLNLNDRVKVKLTPLGAEIYYNRYDFLKSSIRAIGGVCTEPKMPKIDENGYTEMTMWQFIELYGKDIGKINREVIKPLDIIITE